MSIEVDECDDMSVAQLIAMHIFLIKGMQNEHVKETTKEVIKELRCRGLTKTTEGVTARVYLSDLILKENANGNRNSISKR